MTQKIHAFIFLVLWNVISFDAQATSEHIDDNIHAFIHNLESLKSDLQGGAIAILVDDKVVYKTTFGFRKGSQFPVNSQTLFPLASVSKPIAATLLAQLIQAGQLHLNDPWHLPYLKHPLSLQHILSHTSGYAFTGNAQIEQGMSRVLLLKTLNKQTPTSAPGGNFFYSNTVYSLLEDILRTQKLDLSQLITKLKHDLKIQDISLMPIAFNKNIAYPHIQHKNKTKSGLNTLPLPPYYPKTVPASAGIFASIDAMVEVYQLLFGFKPDLLSAATLKEFQTPVVQTSTADIQKWNLDWHTPFDYIESYYGLGWRILKIKGHSEQDLIMHSGYLSGVGTFVGYIPSKKMGIIILINQQTKMALQQGINSWRCLF